MTVDELIEKWWGRKGGQERSNFAPFITDLCLTLGLELPGQAEAGKLGSYEYEGSVPGGSYRSLKAGGRIDLYKRGCFVMEAKQSQLPPERQSELGLFEPAETAPRAPSGARYDKLMADARAQAENYAKNLPGDHPPAPFILVCDVGRAFEIEFDYTGNGRGYGFFPDKQSYRIELPDLRVPAIVDRLRAIWTDPDSISPRFQSAEVTRRIAERLAAVSKWLEETQRFKTSGLSSFERSLAVEETSLFLMRLLFCMFAEDIELLPKDKFKAFLERSLDSDDYFQTGLEDLWNKMGLPNQGNRFAFAVEEVVRYFNGGLFEANTTYVLGREERGELLTASGYNWRKVEPAIFGTLLEQALSKEERAKLGAHYTPRPYVERLVQATIMDVLEAEWAEASQSPSPRGGEGGAPTGAEGEGVLTHRKTTVAEPPHPNPLPDGEREQALASAQSFHDRLANLRILDPACGTGNFLYVAMEALQTLESRVIERIQQLGGTAHARVGPHQFHGLELNPRAAKIAELVLWIGWLRFRIANEPGDIGDPVLASTASINFGRHGGYDAVLRQKETGEPDLDNPMPPEWPEADFIIGNPPFIGKGAEMRAALGSNYVEALWKANPRVPQSADFVMQWWDRAALTLTRPGTRLRRFGFVSTNSITQEFNRRVIDQYLNSRGGEDRLSLIYAIPDHPWTKASRAAAAVRIAMTVAEVGDREGQLIEVLSEGDLNTDTPRIDLSEASGVIHANLSIGVDINSAGHLRANDDLSCNGMMLAGEGFWVDRSQAAHLIAADNSGGEPSPVIRRYIGGSELMQRRRDGYVIDFFGLTESEARQRFPQAYQWLLERVKPERDTNRRAAFRERWWVFGEPRRTFRPALAGLSRYIATTRTSKHRVFQFVEGEILPNHEIVAIASNDAFHLGVLSSRIHTTWALHAGGTLEDRPRYNKGRCFDPFPFPDPTPAQRAAIAELAEELDATRKTALAEMPGLTMTELYNLRDKLRSGAAMTPADQDRAAQARAGIVNRLHEQLDAAIAAAYGWPANLPPSEIVARLVALNAERASEEKTGHVRWLRPDYQEPRFGKKAS